MVAKATTGFIIAQIKLTPSTNCEKNSRKNTTFYFILFMYFFSSVDNYINLLKEKKITNVHIPCSSSKKHKVDSVKMHF